MKIGIQISPDLGKKNKTGIENYLENFRNQIMMLKNLKKHQIFLYTRKTVKWPFKFGWTQIGLSLKILQDKPDILFVPAHTFPIVHPKLVIAIQGLEFEAIPKNYSFFQRKILRFLTKRNLKNAEKIIVPSECTKRDLMESTRNYTPNQYRKYILYLGSRHKRKNIKGLIKAFEILKNKHKIPHKLILAGVSKKDNEEQNIKYKNEIFFTDYVDEYKKWELLKNAEVFVFPSFYEGFGMPPLEAQLAGAPVVASNTSSLPEILEKSALLVNPSKPEEIAEGIYKIISNPDLKESLIKKGYENVKRFNWEKCVKETLNIIFNK